ncbi:MAG: hypothetical protein LBE02_08885 [Spirochaetaceae bacterium]|jgi:hypothetical protein|nr:hypothetical protein [Spirochaetaceae bacterium]
MEVPGFFKNKYVIGFGLGFAAALAAYRVYKSSKFRRTVVKAVACGMKLRDEAKFALNAIKEDAEDLCAEAKDGKAEAKGGKAGA